MGYKFPVPQLKMPEMPDWLRAILEYRFPSSIDPYTGEICNQLYGTQWAIVIIINIEINYLIYASFDENFFCGKWSIN